jgi:hypothetical protein
VTRQRPAADCGEILFATSLALTPSAQVALEDYARVLTRAAAAEIAGGDDTAVTGVHLCGVPSPITDAARRDLTDFARELAARESTGGLGWS